MPVCSQTEATTTATEQPQKADLCTIEGRVLRAVDGSPLKKAAVVALPVQRDDSNRKVQSASTDADGRFLIKDVPPGRYMVAASRAGFVRQEYGERASQRGGTPLSVLAGQQVKDIVFRMIPGAIVTGKVVDEDGEPVYQASVMVQRWSFWQGKKQLMPDGYSSTNDLGEYRIAQLAPGRYLVQVTLSSFGERPGSIPDTHEGYLPTFYPGVHDSGQAVAIDVKAGEEVNGINVRMAPAHAVRVRGTVKGPGVKSYGIGVMLSRKGQEFADGSRFARVDEAGSFELTGVTPGKYVVSAASFADNKRTSARLPIEVTDSDIDNVALILSEGVDINGRVRVEGNLSLKDRRIRVTLSSDEGQGPWGSRMPGDVQDDLTFLVRNCEDGDYRVSVWGLPEDAYLKSASVGGHDVLANEFTIKGPSKPLELVVSANGGRVEGLVTDNKDKAFPGARVVLVPEESKRERRDLFKSGSTDQYGHFSLRGITPGTYVVYAWDSVEEGSYEDPDFLKQYTEMGKEIHVSESSQLTADLKVIPTHPEEGN